VADTTVEYLAHIVGNSGSHDAFHTRIKACSQAARVPREEAAFPRGVLPSGLRFICHTAGNKTDRVRGPVLESKKANRADGTNRNSNTDAENSIQASDQKPAFGRKKPGLFNPRPPLGKGAQKLGSRLTDGKRKYAS
jgi:hypothetical protein